MHCKYFFVIFLFTYAELIIAEDEAWDCEKGTDGQWSCNGQTQVSPPIAADRIKSEEAMPAELTAPQSIPLPAPVIAEPSKPVHVQPPSPPAVAKRPGWNCKASEQDETWNCSLVGADPKGEAKAIGDPEYSSGLFAATFDYRQEQLFNALHAQLKYDPWENCTSPSRNKKPTIAGNDLRNTASMEVTADYSEVFDKEVTSFFGNVNIIRADQNVQSDRASYNTVSDTMDAQGHVFYNENEISLYSETALLNLSTDEARLREALFISPSGPIRGSADVVYRDSKFLTRYSNAAFTSCRPGNQDWIVHAERLKMNQKTGKAAAKHAWLEFKGLPVLYTPYISFPLDDRRLSGLLPPTFGANDKNGIDFSIPYYWNIAPNYDLTVWPRYMSKRGGMLGGEFRYLTEMTSGSLGLEYLPYDTLRKEARFSGTLKNKTRFTDHLNSSIDLNYVSDDEYFDELSNALGLSNDRHLRSQADLNYNTDGIAFSSHLEAYQTIDRDITDDAKPYQKLPQVTLNLDHSFEQWPVDLAVENEYVNFYRNGRVSGHRFNTKPSIAFPIETAGAFLKPKVSLQHTLYELNSRMVGKSDSISRTLPIVSVDSGLFFEKNFEFSDSKYMHTLEPRLFYLYIPEKDQTDIPVFDSSLYDFGFSSLFRENRFSSVDRVQDANQITVAMTSRLIDSETGQERLNLSVGEIFYFKDRNITLSGDPETNSMSNLVAELSGQLTDNISFSSAIQWNPDINDVARGQAEMRYRDQAGKIINVGYRYRKDRLDLAVNDTNYIIQTDASFRWPLYDNWYGVGRWQYSLKFNSTKESFLGLEKESCCWRFRVIWRRFANTVTDSSEGEMDQGVFVQIEFKGLTSFGDKVDNFLEKNLKGYRRAE